MKVSSSATLSVMATGIFCRVDLYQFVLAGGLASYFFTSHQEPVTYNGNVYGTGLVIKRGGIKQKAGLEVQSFDLTVTPQADSAAGVPLIAGLPFLSAASAKVFDGAHVIYSKGFFSTFSDFSAGFVPWAQSRVDTVKVDRQSAKFAVMDDTIILNNALPPNVIQPGCSHVLFDAGCTLNASAFLSSGVAGTGSTVTGCTSNLTQPDDYFTLGRITFTSGKNATSPATTYYVRQYKNSFGTLIPIRPFANAPQAGDTFIVLPGCQHTMAACSNKDATVAPPFNNLPHFDGKPYVPAPETLYSGGVPQGSNPTLGGQGGRNSLGSQIGGRIGGGNRF